MSGSRFRLWSTSASCELRGSSAIRPMVGVKDRIPLPRAYLRGRGSGVICAHDLWGNGMKSNLMCAGLAVMAALCAPPAASAGPVKPVAFPHEQSTRAPDPEARYGRLSNGMSYIIQANDSPAGTAAIYLRVAAGSLVETDRQKGLAHFVEHMAFNGTTNISEGELRRRLERHGFAFGADSNAFTFDTKTLYMLHAPKSDDDTIDEALFILREVASNVRFDPAAVDRERGVILSESVFAVTPAPGAVKNGWVSFMPARVMLNTSTRLARSTASNPPRRPS